MNHHSFKIAELDQLHSHELISNVRLIREMKPKFEDPYVKSRSQTRVKPEWNKTGNMKGANIGSLVNTAPSTTTWKQKFTSY
jgi:hypothetical protein